MRDTIRETVEKRRGQKDGQGRESAPSFETATTRERRRWWPWKVKSGGITHCSEEQIEEGRPRLRGKGEVSDYSAPRSSRAVGDALSAPGSTQNALKKGQLTRND